jgi:hypothetical protein
MTLRHLTPPFWSWPPSTHWTHKPHRMSRADYNRRINRTLWKMLDASYSTPQQVERARRLEPHPTDTRSWDKP